MRAKLIAKTHQIHQLSPLDRARMYSILQKYYDSVSAEQFERDLARKDAVIILRDDETDTIQGFSTLLKKEIRNGGKKALGIFSGDTIIEKEFWGQKSLGIEFLKYLWLEKIKNPLRPVYWFLISKGYKTYLLMANNFEEHYPRYDMEIPASTKRVMDEFYSSLYPGKYEAESGRILFEKCEGKLKEGVADTDPALLASNPRVAYFESRNPGWKHGDELACLARMTFLMPIRYQLKAIFKVKTPPIERRQRQIPVPFERRKRYAT